MTNEPLDPLAMPAGEVDTSFPRLKEGRYRMAIRSPEIKVSDKGTQMVVFRLETTADATGVDDKPIYKGFKFIHRLVGVSGERDASAVAKEGALLLKAIGQGTRTVRSLFDDPAFLEGQIVDVNVRIKKADKGYSESNEVRSFIIPNV